MFGMEGSAAGKAWRLPNFAACDNGQMEYRNNGLLPALL
jgi:hypothetical protein